MSVALDWILYSDRMVGKDSPDYDDTLNSALDQVLVASGFNSYETAFTGFAKRAAHDGTVGQFFQATGATTSDWHTLVTADVTDLTTAATGITKLGTVNIGVWQSTSIATTYTDAKIKTVSGTANRLSVSGTATDPIFNIDPTYVGQASITTLGTVATGVWNASVIGVAYTTAQVVSITGTTNRITIGGTATVPTVDISAAYVGQNTITTVGTIGTGTWNGTAIANAYIASGLDVTKLTVGTTLPSNVVTSSLTAVGTIVTGVWHGSSVGTAYTDAQIVTVTGTASRLTISGTATAPIFDISSAYVGQATITTLGTVGTGTWAATTIGTTVGGTGLTSYALGDILYSSASNTLAKLSGNTGSQMKVLAQTGDGVNSAAPGWYTLVTADITDLTTASTGITKVGTIATGIWNGTVVGATYGGTGVNNGSNTVTLGGNLLTAGSFTTAGAFAITLTATGGTSVTLPTSGTLTNTAGTGATGTWAISISGVAATATILATPRNINGVAFDGSAPITVTAAAGTLTGATLAANVLASSLTSVGVLSAPHVTTLNVDSGGITVTAGTIIAAASLSGAASANIPHGATPSGPNNGDLWTTTSGVFWRVNGATKQTAFVDIATLSSLTSIGTIGTGVWQGTSISTTYTDAKIKTVTGTANRLTIGGSSTDPTFDISTSYVGQATITTLGTIVTGVWNGTAITDTNLATISTAGKVANSATTATSANTASTIVARDASGNFSTANIGIGGAVDASYLLRTYGDMKTDGTTYAAGEVRISGRNDLWFLNANTTAGQRWALRIKSDAESGSVTGSNFEFVAYDNTGVFVDSMMKLTRTGNLIFNAGSTTITAQGQFVLCNQHSYTGNAGNPATYTSTNGASGQATLNSYFAANSDGLGTFPRYLDIVSIGSPDGTTGGSNIRFLTNPITPTSAAPVERMRIRSDGRVGIGTTAPAALLHVSGTGQFDGTVTHAGDVLFTDATYDIGKSGATRPRDGFFSRNVTIGGTATVVGQVTFQAGLSIAAAADANMSGSTIYIGKSNGPAGDPTNGGFIYVDTNDGNKLKFRGSAGTITTLAVA